MNTMKKTVLLVGLLLLVSLIAGCATPGTSRKSVAKPETLPAEEYLTKAQGLEQQGEPVEALKMYKLALTVDPKNSQIHKGSLPTCLWQIDLILETMDALYSDRRTFQR